jgi:hypothetical protein
MEVEAQTDELPNRMAIRTTKAASYLSAPEIRWKPRSMLLQLGRSNHSNIPWLMVILICFNHVPQSNMKITCDGYWSFSDSVSRALPKMIHQQVLGSSFTRSLLSLSCQAWASPSSGQMSWCWHSTQITLQNR